MERKSKNERVTVDRILAFMQAVRVNALGKLSAQKSMTRIAVEHKLTAALLPMLIQAGFLERNDLGKAVYYGQVVSRPKAEEVYAIYKTYRPWKKETPSGARKSAG